MFGCRGGAFGGRGFGPHLLQLRHCECGHPLRGGEELQDQRHADVGGGEVAEEELRVRWQEGALELGHALHVQHILLRLHRLQGEKGQGGRTTVKQTRRRKWASAPTTDCKSTCTSYEQRRRPRAPTLNR
eukprot:1274053-Pyramimonas_sp.AAC.2